MEGVKPKSLMKAVQKLMGQAATAVQDDKRQRRYEQMMKLQEQQQLDTQPYWHNTTTSAAANMSGGLVAQGITSVSTTAANIQQAYNQYANSKAPNWIAGGAGGLYGESAKTPSPPTVSFTDEQMSLFMEKLAHLLSKGWECLRCHRIWNPRETGCEFCNFIDRLEGKDVDRDTAA